LKREIDAGQSFDVAVLTPQLIDDLVRQGTITADTRTPLARSGMGLAIRPGSAKPDISTTEALKRTLLSSSIAIRPRRRGRPVLYGAGETAGDRRRAAVEDAADDYRGGSRRIGGPWRCGGRGSAFERDSGRCAAWRCSARFLRTSRVTWSWWRA
jgi:hypothetical protein